MARRVKLASARALKVIGHGTPVPAAELDHPSRWARPQVRTVAITSGRSGVGKSHFAANVAVALGQRGARVLLVDGELRQASLDLLLGVHPRYDLQHWLLGEQTLDAIVTDGPSNVRLIPAGSGGPELAELDDYRRECLLRGLGQIEGELDMILIDTPAGVSAESVALARACDDVIVMTSPEMSAAADAYALIKVLHQRGLTVGPRLVVSMAGSAEEAEETAHRLRLVARRFLRLDIDVLTPVPFDPAIARAARLQEPTVTAFPTTPASAAYHAVAERLWGGRETGPESTTVPSVEHRLEA